jgi:hypothetical protein
MQKDFTNITIGPDTGFFNRSRQVYWAHRRRTA